MGINIGGSGIRDVVLGAEIQTIQAGADIVHQRMSTQIFLQPQGGGLNWSTPATLVGVPGVDIVDFTIQATASSTSIIAGTPELFSLPDGLELSSHSYNNGGVGNTLTITITGVFPFDNNDEVTIIVGGLGGVHSADFLVAAAGGPNFGAGAGGLRTSWGTMSGGEKAPSGSNIQSDNEDSIILSGGTEYAITVGTTPSSGNGEDSSIIGSGIDITSIGGGRGNGSASESSSHSQAGHDGGSGSGGRNGSTNLSTAGGASGGSGTLGQGYAGGSVGSVQRGGNAGGGGGAAGNGGGIGGGGNNEGNRNGASGPGLSVDITGSNIEYSRGWGTGNLTTPNRGHGGQSGVVILRVPTTLAGTHTNATVTTTGSDTVFTWNSSGTYTAYENLPPAPTIRATLSGGSDAPQSVQPNNEINFTVTGNDPDSSSLEYIWYVNDNLDGGTTGSPVRQQTTTTGSDTLTLTRTTNVRQTIVCVVSDGENSAVVSHTQQWLTCTASHTAPGNVNPGGGVTFRWSYGGDATTWGYSVSAPGGVGGVDVPGPSPGGPLGSNASGSGFSISANPSISLHAQDGPGTIAITINFPATSNFFACSANSSVGVNP